MDDGRWREQAARQAGLISTDQLRELGVSRAVVRHKLDSSRWRRLSARVLSTTTGAPTPDQQLWLGALHAGDDALVGGLAAAAWAGLRGWQRPEVTVLVGAGRALSPVPGIRFVRTRRDLDELRDPRPAALPVCALEPAVLLFAAGDPSTRTAHGILAAVVQQRLTTAARLDSWVERLQPIRRSALLRRALGDIAGGAHSLAEADVRRMCRGAGLPQPRSQQPRRDRGGRQRWTDCEWDLPEGRVLVLEVDGAFHLDAAQWTDDIRRQRRLTTATRVIVRCTALELREDPASVAADLIALGVGRSCGSLAARATTQPHDLATGP